MVIEDILHPMLGFYFSSPQWVKSSLGTAYAIVSSYGRNRGSPRFLAEAAMRDPDQIMALSTTKLAATLRCALESVPAYQAYRHLLTDLDAPFEVLRQLPMISKHDIKRDLMRYVSCGSSPIQRLRTFSGGSTATPTSFFLQKGVTRAKEKAYIGDFHSRVGLDHELVLALRGKSVPTAVRPEGPYWMFEPIKNQLMLSSDHLEREYMEDYIGIIRKRRPAFIQAYPSAIFPLARWLLEHPAPDVTQRIRGIMLFSENVLLHHMELLEQVFDCPVLKHYGHSERVLMAASMPDDERGFFWPLYGFFELVDEVGNPITKPGVLGEIVGTAFDNLVMPFIRYRTGDMAVLGASDHPLLPGWPVVETIEGRRQEFLVCRDARLIAVCGMGAAHTDALMTVDSMQFEQHQPGHFMIKVVAPQKLTVEQRESIAHAMETKTQGGCTVEVVEVDDIARTTRGKHRLLVQHLDIGAYLGAA
jgi:phenylacetate-CoA ligase